MGTDRKLGSPVDGGLLASASTRWGVAWTLLVGLALTTLAAVLVARDQRADLQVELDSLGVELASQLESRVGVIDQTLLTLAAELRVTGADIDVFTAVVTDGRLVENTQGLENLSVAVEYPPPGRDRPATGGTSLVVERIVPVELEAGLDGVLDLYDRGEERLRATTAARDTGGTAASAPLELAYGGRGILYYAPFYDGDTGVVGERRARFLGTSIAVVDIEGLFDGFVGPQPLVDVAVVDLGPVGDEASPPTPVWSNRADTPSTTLRTEVPVEVADRRWSLVATPSPLLGSSGPAVGVTIVGGLLATTALAALVGSLLSSRERAERLVAARTAELASAYELQSNFVSTITHELRTPLTALLGFVETVRARGGQDGVDTVELLTHAERQGRHLDRMIQQLLDFGRLERGQFRLRPEPEDLAVLVPQLVREFEPMLGDRGVALDVDVDGGTTAHVDRDALAHVLGNLLENAVRYSADDLPVEVGVVGHDDVVRLTVTDHGAGIDPADAPYVFERFYRGAEQMGKGTGIGLAVVKEVVEDHGGRVGLERPPGGGTTVAVELPAVEA